MGSYEQARDQALADPSAFWLAAAERIDWVTAPTVGLDESDAPLYRWFPDGVLNTARTRSTGMWPRAVET